MLMLFNPQVTTLLYRSFRFFYIRSIVEQKFSYYEALQCPSCSSGTCSVFLTWCLLFCPIGFELFAFNTSTNLIACRAQRHLSIDVHCGSVPTWCAARESLTLKISSKLCKVRRKSDCRLFETRCRPQPLASASSSVVLPLPDGPSKATKAPCPEDEDCRKAALVQQ